MGQLDTTMSYGPWARPDDDLGCSLKREAEKTLSSYREQPNLVQEHANHEQDTARGGYADRQVFELAQNAADALAAVQDGGRVEVRLTKSHLYCADDGRPIDEKGVIALTFSHMSPKRGSDEIGRFGLGFKSVLGVSDAPEFFSRTGSFRFDPDRARGRIGRVVPMADTFPTLRLPEPIDPKQCRDGDPTLAELMEWANNIVRLPLRGGALQRLQNQIRRFPGEFLLFVDHLRSLTLRDRPNGLSRRFSVRRRKGVHALSHSGGQTRWQIFARQHVLSSRARNDSRTLDDARECLIRWAAPLDGQSGTGYFWAFFPTLTASLVPGILNAPWKTNEDRQNLLPGPYNNELIDAGASLVADSLPRLATDKDPAKHLDALPRRKEQGDTEQSSRLRRRLFFEVANTPVVPGQDGTPRHLRKLHFPPKALTSRGREALDAWAKYSRRPKNWAHNRVVTRDRLAKVVRLFDCLPGSSLESPVLSQHSIAEWLEALVKYQPPAERARASMAAVKTATRIPRDVRPSSPQGFGRIVLLANGQMHAPDPESIFLPDPDAATGGTPTSQSEIHPEVAQNVEANSALRQLGIRMASPESRFSDAAATALNGPADPTDSIWEWLWECSRRLEPTQVLEIARQPGWVRMPHVRTLQGEWAPIHSVLLPGPIVDGSGGEDAEATVDTGWHAEDMQLLHGLGVVSEPREGADLSIEPWFQSFQQGCRKELQERAREHVGTTPQPHLIRFDRTVAAGPLHVLTRLSPQAAARYTVYLLSLQPTYDPWVMRHKSQTQYPPMKFESPAKDRLITYGWVDTERGPVRLREALGPRPQSTAALYALLNHPQTDRIRRAFELTEPAPVFTGEVDPVPLVDRWPGLRDHLRDDQQGTNLRLCDDIAVAGRERRCVLHGGDIFMSIAVDDESQQLSLIAVRLALRLNADQLERIQLRRTVRQVEERRKNVRKAATDAERLLRAVGEDGLRARLGDAVLTILERRMPLTGVQIAEAVIATHHTDSLRQCKWALDHLDPPKQWAGSTAAIRFVRSLGFSRAWAGQRGKRRDSYLEVHGPFRLPPLHRYQEKIAANVRSLLRGGLDQVTRRGLISLPTGSGKTRVAVQSLVAAICEDGFSGAVLWVADRDELCEQAVEAWTQVWSAIGKPEPLRVTRLWGNQPNPERLDTPHVIVATIQTLATRLKRRDGWDNFLADIRVVVFDEAHRSIAPTSTSVLGELGLTRWKGSPRVRLIGLTATPYRGHNETETAWLVQRYGNNRLDRGAFRSSNQEEVVRELQEDGILATVDHETIEGGDFDPTERELALMADAPWLPKRAEDILTRNTDRTRRILRACEDHIRKDRPALIFATSVEHAGILAALLSARGIRARAVSGKTEIATRRRIVDEFRNGDILALVNYAVFREGFDAPKTRVIVVARPVFSPNLYFQMIGRGMRGKRNGGNDRCLVLNVRDNIQQFDRALAFTELDWLWAGSFEQTRPRPARERKTWPPKLTGHQPRTGQQARPRPAGERKSMEDGTRIEHPQDFWQGFREFVQDQSSTTLTLTKPGGGGRWMVTGRFGISGTHIGAVRFPDNRGLCAELVLQGDQSSARYECLRAYVERIRSDQRFPEELTWSRERTRMYWTLATDFDDENQRMRQYRWLFERLEELQRLFGPLLRELHDHGWPVPKGHDELTSDD